MQIFLFQRDNGRFELVLEKDGDPFDVFEVYPERMLNEGNFLIRVKNSADLDYEEVTEFSFEVIISHLNIAEAQ